MFLRKISLTMVLVCASIVASANDRQQVKDGFIYGVGVNYSQEIYKGYDSRFIPIPVIGYRSERLNVFGPFVSYRVLASNNLKIAFELAPRFQGFDESDSDFFLGLSKRKDSLDAGISAEYQYGHWKTKVTSMFDILNNANGFEVETKLAYAYRMGPIFIEPSVAANYESSKLVDYYYGVGELETLSNRPFYKGESGISYSAGISLSTPIFLGGFTRMSINSQWFGPHITESPLVDASRQIGVNILFSKSF